MKLRLVFILMLFIFPLLGSGAQFLSVTDIHFDPFSTCSLNSIPCPIVSKLIANRPEEWPAIYQLKTENFLVPIFKAYYAVGNITGSPIETRSSAWPYYWCAIHHFTMLDYEACLLHSPRY